MARWAMWGQDSGVEEHSSSSGAGHVLADLHKALCIEKHIARLDKKGRREGGIGGGRGREGKGGRQRYVCYNVKPSMGHVLTLRSL